MADEKRHAELPWISIPARDHQPRRMAVPSILCELSRCRRSPGPTRHHGVLRSNPALVHPVRFGIRSKAQASTGPAGRHMALGRGLRHHPGTAARHYLWRAVDQDGDVIDILVQSRRDRRAAKRFIRKLLKGQGSEPGWLVTDKLRSYRAAHREVMPSVVYSTERYENNRAEVSHQPTRQRERQMRRFKSPGQAQRFLSVHGLVRNLFHVGRHLLRAEHHRELRGRSFLIWDAVTIAA